MKVVIVKKLSLVNLAHPIPWYLLAGFIFMCIHNVLTLKYKIDIDTKNQIANQFNDISRLYHKGTYISN